MVPTWKTTGLLNGSHAADSVGAPDQLHDASDHDPVDVAAVVDSAPPGSVKGSSLHELFGLVVEAIRARSKLQLVVGFARNAQIAGFAGSVNLLVLTTRLERYLVETQTKPQECQNRERYYSYREHLVTLRWFQSLLLDY
jgi:hypothetical protein